MYITAQPTQFTGVCMVALRGQMHCNIRKHQQIDKPYKSSQNTTEVELKKKKHVCFNHMILKLYSLYVDTCLPLAVYR